MVQRSSGGRSMNWRGGRRSIDVGGPVFAPLSQSTMKHTAMNAETRNQLRWVKFRKPPSSVRFPESECRSAAHGDVVVGCRSCASIRRYLLTRPKEIFFFSCLKTRDRRGP